jgi:hypothetical protein
MGKRVPYRIPDRYRRSTGNVPDKRYLFDDEALAGLVSFVYCRGWEDRDAVEVKRKTAEEGPLAEGETIAARHEKHRLEIPDEILATKIVQLASEVLDMMRTVRAQRQSRVLGLDGNPLVVPSNGEPN